MRNLLVFLSYIVLMCNVSIWWIGLRLYGSELLPIMILSTINLLLLFIYWGLGKIHTDGSNLSEHKAIKILSRLGFMGNVIIFILSILIIIGFGIIP